ncbi:hypothetical protein U9M48_033293 [Paspalum notatum var. saurae]|uniref:Uncharacterized protein n=1 Tax=Paspalum notatum var. saurae TaxID=547442 RepID=A0AAQ3X5V7_PASNO
MGADFVFNPLHLLVGDPSGKAPRDRREHWTELPKVGNRLCKGQTAPKIGSLPHDALDVLPKPRYLLQQRRGRRRQKTGTRRANRLPKALELPSQL